MPSEAIYDVVVERDVLVTARDGVTLATDIYRPARDGRPVDTPFPMLLQRTPYNKQETEEESGDAPFFARHGYVCAVQDCRGCFASGGDLDFLLADAEDGADTVEWLGRQAFGNGRVGTWGTSWAGWTQTALAALAPSNLYTMVPNMSGSNAHNSSVRQGGAMELRFMAWAFWHSAYNTQAKLSADLAALNFGAPSFRDWLSRMPIRPGMTQLALVPAYERWVFDLFTRADYDEYWLHPSLNPQAHYDRFPDMPVLWVGGWYDSYTRGTIENFEGLEQTKSAPQHLLMGPWTHGHTTMQLDHAGDVEFGPEAAVPSFLAVQLRWFDRWLKGVGNGIDDEAPVRLFVMGGEDGRRGASARLRHGGRWREETTWPLPRATSTDFYFHANGGLRLERSADAQASTSYSFDPGKPVPSCGGCVSSLRELRPLSPGITDPSFTANGERTADIMEAGAFDQVERADRFGCAAPYLPLGARHDVLVFQTEPLTEPLEVTGPITVKLWVSSSAVDTDFTAKLIDLYPPSQWYPYGFAMNLTDSIMRLRYRNGPERAELVEPGEVVALDIVLYPTSNRFMPGHRIRLDISSSNFPRFDVNPNTGEPIGRDRRRVIADNTVHHDAVQASRVVLPVIAP